MSDHDNIKATNVCDHGFALGVGCFSCQGMAGKSAIAENKTYTPVFNMQAPLYRALAKAQSEIRFATKDSNNPHFNRKYADLASVWEACRDALTKNGICVIQRPITRDGMVGCMTTIAHESGGTIESDILWTAPRDQGPQAIGSCVTYLRRYQLAAMVGVAPDDDDDGENAEGRLVRGNDTREYRRRVDEDDFPRPPPTPPSARQDAQRYGGKPEMAPGQRRSEPGTTDVIGSAVDYVAANHPSMAPRDVSGEKVTKQQLAEIHILKNALLQWDDWPKDTPAEKKADVETFSTWPMYRRVVGAYRKSGGERCLGANELQRHQADNLIKRMRAQKMRNEKRERFAHQDEGANLAAILGNFTDIDDIFDRVFPMATMEAEWLIQLQVPYRSRADIPESEHARFISLLQAFKQGGDTWKKEKENFISRPSRPATPGNA